VLDWFRRSAARRRDLARGVDADLVRDADKRFRLALYLLGPGFLLVLILSNVHFEGFLRAAGSATAAVLLSGGMFLGWWSRVERGFLNKPDPKEPPSLFKG